MPAFQNSHGSDTLAREIALFTTNRQETDAIKEIRRALFVLPPTSVESERVFSASGLFLSKLRCNLNDSSLDMLIFLKFYFARNNRLVKGQYSITKQSAHGNAFKVFNFYLRSTNFTNINFIEDLS